MEITDKQFSEYLENEITAHIHAYADINGHEATKDLLTRIGYEPKRTYFKTKN